MEPWPSIGTLTDIQQFIGSFPKEEKTRIYVDVSRLFDDNIIERLLNGERAENIVGMPEDIARELSVIANNVVVNS